MILWARTFGSRAGDELLLTLTGPEGEVISDSNPAGENPGHGLSAIGRKLKTGSWPPGRYTGTAKLIRSGQDLDRLQITTVMALGPRAYPYASSTEPPYDRTDGPRRKPQAKRFGKHGTVGL